MKTILSLLLLVFGINAAAQQYLYIQKGNEVPHHRVGIDDLIHFKTKGGAKFISGYLKEINGQTIRVDDVLYPLNEIEAFRTYNELLKVFGSAAAAGGILYMAITLINRTTSSKLDGGLKSSHIIIGSAMVAGGLIMRLAARRTYKAQDGWRWKVIDLDKSYTE